MHAPEITTKSQFWRRFSLYLESAAINTPSIYLANTPEAISKTTWDAIKKNPEALRVSLCEHQEAWKGLCIELGITRVNKNDRFKLLTNLYQNLL